MIALGKSVALSASVERRIVQGGNAVVVMAVGMLYARDVAVVPQGLEGGKKCQQKK